MQRAQELMKLTELPDGVELQSDVDEDESSKRRSAITEDDDLHRICEQTPIQKEESSVESVDEDETYAKFVHILQ